MAREPQPPPSTSTTTVTTIPCNITHRPSNKQHMGTFNTRITRIYTNSGHQIQIQQALHYCYLPDLAVTVACALACYHYGHDGYQCCCCCCCGCCGCCCWGWGLDIEMEYLEHVESKSNVRAKGLGPCEHRASKLQDPQHAFSKDLRLRLHVWNGPAALLANDARDPSLGSTAELFAMTRKPSGERHLLATFSWASASE